MIKLGKVSKHELELVNRLVHHCEPPEHLAKGVLLTTKNGKRVWQVGALTANMTVVGSNADFEGSYIIFGRFIQAAYSQCGVRSSCELTIDNNEITATVDGGTTTMITGTKTYPLRKFDEPEDVFAYISVGEYNRIFGNITNIPTGCTDWESLFEYPFSAIIKVTDGKVSVQSRWPKLKTPEIVMSCEAVTGGEGKIVLPDQAIGYMSLCIHPEETELIKISFAAKDPSYARFESGPVTVVVEKSDILSGQPIEQFVKHLESNQFEFQVGPDGILAVNYENTSIRVQLFDGFPTIARCTKTILVDVKCTPELLAEINAMNVGRALNRIWYDNGMVVIGSDLIVKKDMDSVQYTLERLKRESDGLEATFTQITEPLLGTTPKPEEETK
jgi:hypothetical protein